MDEYTILKKKRKKNGFASTALLISIAIALIAMVGAVLILSKIDNKKTVTSNEESVVEKLSDDDSDEDEDTTCDGYNKEVVFNENLKTIKEAAISYFTNERLPQTTGESVTITLKDMKSSKLVRNILDASGKSCNSKESYVEVTKDDNEYIMKVFLSCSNMEDYIIVHLGCYDYCDSNVCEKKVEKEYEYEYKKTNSCELGEWSNWGKWTTTRQKTSNLKKEDIKVEKISKKVTDTKNATKIPGTYSCSNYPGYTLSGTKCVKETIVKDIKNATISGYSYNCDKYPGYSVVGSQCVKETKKKEVIDAYKNPTTYTCPSGYSLNGTKCERSVTKTSTTTGSYVCGSGYSLSGTKCSKTTTTTDTKTGSYVCPSGYSLSGTKCSKTTTSTETINADPVYETRNVIKGFSCKKQQCTTKTVFSCSNGKCGNTPQTSCEYVNSTCYNSIPEKYLSGYSCPSGYSKNGSTCYKTVSNTDTKNATFTCPSGYTVSGTSCKKTISSTDTKNATFTCPSGYTVSGTSCTKKYQETEKINATENPATYYCKSGYILSGTKCERTVIVSDSKEATKVNGGYLCPSGYRLDGTKCIKETIKTDTKNADSTKTVYTCPSGYTISGTKCNKNGTQTVSKTYYRYATRECTGGSTSYEWSTSKNDSILKSEGYKLTGKKRELIIK